MVRMDLNRKHAVTGFLQINEEQNVALRKIVADLARAASGRELLLDLYGGDGNLTGDLRSHFKRIISVDTVNEGGDPSEIAPPLPPGRTFVRADTKEFLTGQFWRDWSDSPIDAVIADPPRSGLEGTADLIASLDTRSLILVSCDPSTLSRDLIPILKRFALSRIALIDMFPQTHHIEAVVGLRRQS
ncbi:MAG: hypothetical protein HYW49_03555 [Deltaproteobacteria bacterium]|nr:hypothetical protein [Deltaproteobacteria bacterium]